MAKTSEVRGARDLAELWRALPAAVLQYPVAGPPGPGLAALSGALRNQAWNDHCAAAPDSCNKPGRSCRQANQGRCRADALFPAQIGGGAQSWRMATLFLHWRPSFGEMHLIALGETACAEFGWAARCLRGQHGLEGGRVLDVSCFADLELAGALLWRLTFVTPWVVGKNLRCEAALPNAETVAHELIKGMRARAHKLTALCTRDSIWQRLGGHLALHIADVLLPAALSVEEICIEEVLLPLQSRGNHSRFEAHAWTGEITLAVSEPLLPWLSLLAICGGGKNADKGFGSVELKPLPPQT